jgi:hypothetical protein
VPDISAPYLSGQELIAVYTDDDANTVRCGELKLRYRWRRTLGDMVKTHNDPDGLREITKGASAIGISLDNIQFRIWHEDQTGAYVAVPADWRLIQQNNRCVMSPRDNQGGSVEVFGKKGVSNSDAQKVLDAIQMQEQDTKPRGMTVSIDFRIFRNEQEILTNAALINRRAYQGVVRTTGDAALITQTGFVRSGAALIALGRTSMTVDQAMYYRICDMDKWQGDNCMRVKQGSVETAKALLATALSTIPDS